MFLRIIKHYRQVSKATESFYSKNSFLIPVNTFPNAMDLQMLKRSKAKF